MKEPIERFVDKINKDIISKIDYGRLEKSCTEGAGEYAKEALGKLHKAFVDVYGSNQVDESTGDMVMAPAVIRARKSGRLCLGLVTLDITSSGEHWGSSFLTRFGVLDQGDEQLAPKEKDYIKGMIPYDYWYTIALPRDFHVDFASAPKEVKELLDSVLAPQTAETQIMNGMQDIH